MVMEKLCGYGEVMWLWRSYVVMEKSCRYVVMEKLCGYGEVMWLWRSYVVMEKLCSYGEVM